MLYRVGQRVKILPPKAGERTMLGFVWDMNEYIGTTQTIGSVKFNRDMKPYYTLKGICWNWLDNWFEPIADNTIYPDDLI